MYIYIYIYIYIYKERSKRDIKMENYTNSRWINQKEQLEGNKNQGVNRELSFGDSRLREKQEVNK